MYIKIMTLIFLLLTVVLSYNEYKDGKMSARNFRIVYICEGIAFIGMIYLILVQRNQQKCGMLTCSRNMRGAKSTHKLRRTYVSRMKAGGVSLDTIRKDLGHKNILTTDKYIFETEEDDKVYEKKANACSTLQ